MLIIQIFLISYEIIYFKLVIKMYSLVSVIIRTTKNTLLTRYFCLLYDIQRQNLRIRQQVITIFNIIGNGLSFFFSRIQHRHTIS